MKAVRYSLPGATLTLLNAAIISSFVKILARQIESRVSRINGMGYRFFSVTLLMLR
jgi:hypothetical protein